MNNLNINNCQNSMAFTGNIYLKGKWPKKMKKAFVNSECIKSMTKEKDVFAKVIKKDTYESFLPEKSYIIGVNVYDEKSHFNWLRNLLRRQPMAYLTHEFHSEKRTIARFDDEHFYYLLSQLGM